jgi:small subunit ribosomal protein S17
MQERRTRTLAAVVLSKSGNKSIKVAVDYKVRHPKYNKYVRRRTRLGVHDERNQADIGDKVQIVECRPRSKTKSWRLQKVLEKAIKV